MSKQTREDQINEQGEKIKDLEFRFKNLEEMFERVIERGFETLKRKPDTTVHEDDDEGESADVDVDTMVDAICEIEQMDTLYGDELEIEALSVQNRLKDLLLETENCTVFNVRDSHADLSRAVNAYIEERNKVINTHRRNKRDDREEGRRRNEGSARVSDVGGAADRTAASASEKGSRLRR